MALGLEVTIRRQAMVTPSEPTPARILWNSNVDLVIPRIHTQSVYFYKNNDGSEDFLNHEKLAMALAKTLVPFYPMAGRLRRGAGGRVEINCNAQGVLLVEAQAEAGVADFGEFAPDPRFRQLVPQIDYSQDIASFPLLVLQVTFFRCGGAALGVGMQHHVADGMSGIHCINTWSEMARGIPLRVQPFIDRTLLKANSPPAPKYPHIEYQPPPRLIKREIAKHGHENGASHGNGHDINGSLHVANGKNSRSRHGANGNGIHAENGKSNGIHVENWKSNGVDYGMHVRNINSNGYDGSNGAQRDNQNGNGNGISIDAHLANGNSDGYGCSHEAHHYDEDGNDYGIAIETTFGNTNSNGYHKDVQPSMKKLTNGHSNGHSDGHSNGHGDSHASGKGVQEEDTAMAVRVFRFTKEQLTTLKQMAVEGKTDDVIFSSYEMLSGHIWKCVTQARELDDSQETKLFVATDGRNRLVPPLPPGYFGNVIFTCTPIATTGELVRNPVTYAARKIHDALARMNDEYLRSALDYLQLQEDVSKLVRGAHHFNSPNLGITSWARMPVYDCDFGWGRPVFMGPSAIAYEGLAYVLASPVGDGSLSLSLGLRADHMATFAKLVVQI